ncbi:MAG: hypothetical protein V1493_00290 [Candidatus Diapherotrites archaeon]
MAEGTFGVLFKALLAMGGLALFSIALTVALTFFYFSAQALLAWPRLGNAMPSAYCSDKVVIINALTEARDIGVQDMEGNTICTFGRISANSAEFCKVGRDGVFAVTLGERKQAVQCNGFAGYVSSYD